MIKKDFINPKIKNLLFKASFKFLLFLFLSFFFFKSLIAQTFPITLPPPDGGTPSDELNRIYLALYDIAQWLFGFLAVGALIGVLIGAFMIATSAGDSGKTSLGKKMVIISLIAILIGSSAWTLVMWVAT